MHTIEPYYNWRHLYVASEDSRSPFYGNHNSEISFTDHIYDFVIHPQWDFFGSETLFIKLLYADYENRFAIIEMLGEWNDVLHNDVMFLKRDVIDPLIAEGIEHFILVGENVLNFHADITDYYEEWIDDLAEGWVAAVNLREHVLREMSDYNIDQFFVLGGKLSDFRWRTKTPQKIFKEINQLVQRRLTI